MLGELSRKGLIKTIEFDRLENRYEENRVEHLNSITENAETSSMTNGPNPSIPGISPENPTLL